MIPFSLISSEHLLLLVDEFELEGLVSTDAEPEDFIFACVARDVLDSYVWLMREKRAPVIVVAS